MVPAAPKDYQISPDDLLEVYVFDVPEISANMNKSEWLDSLALAGRIY